MDLSEFLWDLSLLQPSSWTGRHIAKSVSIFSCVYTAASMCCYFSIPHTVKERALHPGKDKRAGFSSLCGMAENIPAVDWGGDTTTNLCVHFFLYSCLSHHVIIRPEGSDTELHRCRCKYGWAQGGVCGRKIILVDCIIIAEKQLVTEHSFDGCVTVQWTHVGWTKKEPL